MSNTVTVIGSYNVGLFLKGKVLPHTGETIIANSFFEGGGGKGSNQAIAASKMGAKTRFIGHIGDDNYGKDALKMYRNYGINTDMIQIDEGVHTGIGAILIDENGQNLISVYPGANYSLSEEDIDNSLDTISDSDVVGFQLESNLETVLYGIKKISAMGIKILLDPAPATELPQDLYPYIYLIKPNEHEAETLTGIHVDDFESARQAGQWFIKKGVKIAVITLGGQGAVLVTREISRSFRSVQVKALDTTGAGDCFSGALMACLSKGKKIEESIIFANYAAALSVTKMGVIDAIPGLAEVEAFKNKFPNERYEKL